jgi:myo-inositol-1-phosphate synthase
MSNRHSIRVAIVGVGNCASALVQGVDLYSVEPDKKAGLMFHDIGGYTASDIDFVAAYDVDVRKVGKTLRQAIFEGTNNCFEIFGQYCTDDEENEINPIVRPAPLIDGVAYHMQAFREDDKERFYLGDTDEYAKKRVEEYSVEEYAQQLRDLNVDVLLNYLPVGSQMATEFWAEVCIAAEVNMVNCIPCFIASNKTWAKKFADRGVTIIGDDMRSQVGASIISAALQELFLQRGAEIEVHYQDNVGGNTDFFNMQDQSRLASKKISKENVIRRQNDLAGVETKENSLAAGPAKYFPALGDNKRAHWLIKGTVFGGAPFEFTADLSVQDSPNSAGVVIDAIRLVTVANELGIVGPVVGPSAATQKTPPVDMSVRKAWEECQALAERKMPEGYAYFYDDSVGNTVVSTWLSE